MPIAPCRWARGKSSCAYCGVAIATDGDHVVADCLYTNGARKRLKNVLTVPACHSCNELKGTFDASLQHYLLIDVDASRHPEAQQLFDSKLITAIATDRVRLVDRFHEGQTVSEFTLSGILIGDSFGIPIDSVPVRVALNYIVKGLHYAVFGEVKQTNEVATVIVEREERNRVAKGFFEMGIEGHHLQGDVFTVAWVIGSSNVYWLFDFYSKVLCLGRSARSSPLYGPPTPPGLVAP